jgi:hypothetical protein
LIVLDKKGAAVRYVTRFREYALARKTADAVKRIKLLSSCDLMRPDLRLPLVGPESAIAREVARTVAAITEQDLAASIACA